MKKIQTQNLNKMPKCPQCEKSHKVYSSGRRRMGCMLLAERFTCYKCDINFASDDLEEEE